MMKTMLKINVIKKIIKKKNKLYEWSFLTIRVTVKTNKALITDKTLTGEEKKKTYLLHPNYEQTFLSNMQRKHDVH